MDRPTKANDIVAAIFSFLVALVAERMSVPLDTAICIGLTLMGSALVWGHRPRLAASVALILVPAALLLGSLVFHRVAQRPKLEVGAQPSATQLTAFWLSDSVVGENLFFRVLACGDEEIEIEGKHVVLPFGAENGVEPISAKYEQNPSCKIVYAGSRSMDRIGRPTILGIVYHRRGQANTQATSLFFFDPTLATVGQSMASIERQDLKGNRLDDLRIREIQLQMAYPDNIFKLTIPEMYGGNPVEMGFGERGKAFLFQPLTKSVAFCALQSGVVRSRSAELDPSHANGHQIIVQYNDRRATIDLVVDGVRAKDTHGFRDELCKRSIRPPIAPNGARRGS